MSQHLVVGVDLGGTHVSAAVINHLGECLSKADRNITRDDPPDKLLRQDVALTIREAVKNAGLDMSYILGVGMGLPGNIDRARGICRYSPNFQWHDVPVSTPLQEVLGCPVFLLNDVRSHTLGEFHFGAGQDCRSFAMLALGTGLGGGVVVDGRLIEGSHSAGGEIGHVTIDPDGPLCGCGNHGCVEAFVGAPGIARLAREMAARGDAPGLLERAGSLEAIDASVVDEAGRQGDPAALDIWDRVGRWLGRGIVAVVAAVDPEKVLIGGKVARAGDMLLGPAREELGRRFRMIPPGTTPVVLAALGDDAGLIGAGALALECLEILPTVLQSNHR